MGQICSRAVLSGVKNKLPQAAEAALPQVLILGPQGAGKTTLFYKTFFPSWDNIAAEITPTESFHYEVLTRGSMRMGIWEVAGNPTMMNLWSTFYRSMDISVLVYVVSLLEVDAEVISENRRILRLLFNEDELKKTSFCVILNTFDLPSDSICDANSMISQLGLSEKEIPFENRWRLSWHTVNAKDGEADQFWREALGTIVTAIHRRMQV